MSDGAVPAAPEAAGLYVHVPYCRTKCPYCDFYSLTDTSHLERWVAALVREAGIHATRFELFDSLYLGGGTPTFLGAANLARLMATLRENFLLAPDTEITVEANPDDVTPELLEALLRLGVNRISVGAQSFEEERLRFLDRRHTAEETRQALRWIREAGFNNLGVDLIYGFVGQRRDAWFRSIEEALAFTPEHLSCYLLTLEPRTPFGKLHAQGRLPKLDDDTEGALFQLTSEHLRTHGYEHYEISNFARSPSLRSRHNQKYWRHVPYLGLGPSAHSFDGRTRWWNTRSIDRYLSSLEAGSSPVEDSETLTDHQRLLEELYLGLRCTDGLDESAVRRARGGQDTAAALEAEGLVVRRDGRYVPTLAGYLVSDGLPLRFEI